MAVDPSVGGPTDTPQNPRCNRPHSHSFSCPSLWISCPYCTCAPRLRNWRCTPAVLRYPGLGAASEGAVSGGVDWRGKKQEEHRQGLLPMPLHTLLPAQWVYLSLPCVSGPVVLHQGSEGRGVPSLAAVGPCPLVRGQAVGFQSTMMWCIVLVPTRNPFGS